MDAATPAIVVTIVGLIFAAGRYAARWIVAQIKEGHDDNVRQLAAEQAAEVAGQIVAAAVADLRTELDKVLDSRPITNGEGIATLRRLDKQVADLARQVDANQRSIARTTGNLAHVHQLVANDLREQRTIIDARIRALEILARQADAE